MHNLSCGLVWPWPTVLNWGGTAGGCVMSLTHACLLSAARLAAKPGGHAAVGLLPGCVWCAGLLQELRAPQPCGQQGVCRGDGAHAALHLQVSAASECCQHASHTLLEPPNLKPKT
jgi:hypothetical protein